MATTISSRRLTEQEWACHELTIRELYLNKDESLQVVMSKMARDYGFNATKSQYETRLKKWGIAKHRKQTDWKAVAQHVQRRKAAGKASAVFIEGNPISEAKIQREIVRLGYRLPRSMSNSGVGASLPLPPGFRIQTPPPMRPDTPVSELPTIRLVHELQDQNAQTPVSLLSETPAFIDPQALLAVDSHLPQLGQQHYASVLSSLPDSPLGSESFDTVVLHEVNLLTFLPPTQLRLLSNRTSAADNGIGSTSAALLESQSLNTSYGRFLVFQLINNFAESSESSPAEIWASLKAIAGHRLGTFFRQLRGHESKIVVEKAFQCAVEAGDSEGVQLFMDTRDIKIDPNKIVCDHDGYFFTALQQAVVLKQVPMIRMLLSYGADANRVIFLYGQGSMDPLHLAITHFSNSPDGYELINLLLQHGAVVTQDHLKIAILDKDQDIFDCLFRAGTPANQAIWAQQGYFHDALEFFDEQRSVRLLNDLGRPEIMKHLKSLGGYSGNLLSASVKYGKFGFARRLLREHSFQVEQDTLRLVAMSGNTDLLRLLLERVGRSEASLPMVGSAYPFGIRSNVGEISELLEQYGALDYIKSDVWEAYKAFEAGFAVGNFDIAKRLLDLGVPRTPEILGAGLFKAVQLGQHELVKWLLGLGADPKYVEVNKDGHYSEITTLTVALEARDVELVRLILRSPDINLTSPPFTPLIKAVEWGDNTIVRDLILAGSPVNTPAQSTTPLMLAIMRRDRDTIDTLIQLGASVNLPVQIRREKPDPFPTSHWKVQEDESIPPRRKRMTPLAAAVVTGDIDLVRFLLSEGADPADSRALTEACLAENEQLFNILLEMHHKRYPRGRAGYGFEAMKTAIRRGNLSLVSKLLAHNVRFPTLSSLRDTHAEDSVYLERTPLVDAIERNDEIGFAIFRMMLDADRDAGVTPDLGAIIYQNQVESGRVFSSTRSETALLVAIRVKQLDKVRLLVERGADVNVPSVRGVSRSPVQAAVETGDFKIVEFLIHSGADVNAPPVGYGGATALQLAAVYGYAGIIDLLLRSGADVNALPSLWSGRTALEGAAEHGRFDAVVMLLDAGARIDGEFRQYFERAIQGARQYGHLAVANMLAARDPILIQEDEVVEGPQGESANIEDEDQADCFIDWSKTS
ncbi:ankyrin repeat-containing domain protein [Annulohypoxylon moriforme]|nr:ankyrin repeat-containing domain protein [Annulohypoxylon moriforme]